MRVARKKRERGTISPEEEERGARERGTISPEEEERGARWSFKCLDPYVIAYKRRKSNRVHTEWLGRQKKLWLNGTHFHSNFLVVHVSMPSFLMACS
jgi:hypothetical protein